MTDLIWHRQITPVTWNNTSPTQGTEGSAGVLEHPKGIISTGPSGLQSTEIPLLFRATGNKLLWVSDQSKELSPPKPCRDINSVTVYHAVQFDYREKISGVCVRTKCVWSVLLFPEVNA